MKDTMEYKGFKAQIMEAERLIGSSTHGLPPGNAINAYYADEFINWPENWMKGGNVFLVPVNPNKGLWFNFRMNSEINTAIILTIKGCNPITGLQTSGIHMERYDVKCPKHGIEFKGDRFCSECGYKWPSQNYITGNPLWLDGFINTIDGTVRQFFFTEDEIRDVATHMIGKENTVPAFGFAFYTPKEPRPEYKEQRGSHYHYSKMSSGIYSDILYKGSTNVTYTSGTVKGLSVGGSTSRKGSSIGAISATNNGDTFYSPCLNPESLTVCSESDHNVYSCQVSETIPMAATFGPEEDTKIKRLNDMRRYKKGAKTPVKEVSIGAGAKINQELVADPYALDTWKESPDASMVIYFVFHEKLEELKSGGMVDLVGKKEGMLDGIPIG